MSPAVIFHTAGMEQTGVSSEISWAAFEWCRYDRPECSADAFEHAGNNPLGPISDLIAAALCFLSFAGTRQSGVQAFHSRTPDKPKYPDKDHYANELFHGNFSFYLRLIVKPSFKEAKFYVFEARFNPRFSSPFLARIIAYLRPKCQAEANKPLIC